MLKRCNRTFLVALAPCVFLFILLFQNFSNITSTTYFVDGAANVALDPNVPDSWVAVTSRGIYTNTGLKFALSNAIPGGAAFDPNVPGSWVAVTSQGIYTGAGLKFALSNATPGAVAFDPNIPGSWVATTSQGIYTGTGLQIALSNAAPGGVAFDPNYSGLWAAVTSQGIYTNNGLAVPLSNAIPGGVSFAPDTQSPFWVAVTSQGIYNNGKLLVSLSNAIPGGVAFDPNYLDMWVATTSQGIYTNTGLAVPLSNAIPGGVAFAPDTGSSYWVAATSQGIYNNGKLLVSLSNATPGGVAFDPNVTDSWVAVTSQGIYGSNGNSISLSNATPQGAAFDLLGSATWVAATAQGIYENGKLIADLTQSSPPAPTGFAASSITTSSLKLSWTSGGGGTSGFLVAYQIGAIAPASCGSGTILNPGSATSLNVNGLAAGATYSFRVCSINSAGMQTSGPMVSATTTSIPSPAPTGLADSSITASGLVLSWKSGGGSTSGFLISYQSGMTAPANCSSGIVLNPGSATSLNVSGLAVTTKYSFRLCSVNSVGTQTSGPTISATTLSSPPPAPTGLTDSSITASGLKLSWTSGGGSTSGFLVSYQSGTTAPANCSSGTVLNPGGATSLSVSALAAGSSYSFRLCSVNSAGTQTSGPAISAMTLSSPAPAPLNFTAGSVTKSGLVLNWVSGGGSTLGFVVAYQSGSIAPASCTVGTLINPGSAKSISVSGLSTATKYSFRLCSVNSVGVQTSGPTTSVTTLSR